MSALKENNILLNWSLAYVGLTKNWLSASDILAEINPEELNKLSDDTIGELYIAAEESKDDFLNLLKKIGNLSDALFKEGLWVWGIAYLNVVQKTNKSVSEKLKDIANIWAMMDYPENWKQFIYYMPVSEDEEIGEDRIYQKFVSFLEQEHKKLKII